MIGQTYGCWTADECVMDEQCPHHSGCVLATSDEQTPSSVDSLIRAMYVTCGYAWVDSADIDQWWRVRLACDHGEWIGISNGPIDLSTAFASALVKMREAEHPDPDEPQPNQTETVT